LCTGYLAIRFLIRQRKHFGWLELQRSVGEGKSYTLKRIAYNRFYEKPIAVP